jgi:hypothetical protein
MKEFSLLSILVCSFAFAMVVITSPGRDTCKINVTMNDGQMFKAKRITKYDFGVMDIRKCSGERIQIQTRTVKKIKFIK